MWRAEMEKRPQYEVTDRAVVSQHTWTLIPIWRRGELSWQLVVALEPPVCVEGRTTAEVFETARLIVEHAEKEGT